jgi:hypothetical protein
MKNLIALVSFLVCLSQSVASGHGNENPWWQPFGLDRQVEPESDGSRESSVFGQSNSGGVFKLPQWNTPQWPESLSFTGFKNQTSTTFRQARRSTRRWWNRTMDFLLPFDNEMVGEMDEAKQTGSSNWFGWFGGKPEERDISTVNDFLKQERPRF